MNIKQFSVRQTLTSIILFIIILFSSSTVIFAHSGKTDSSGGHYNHSTGEYHYHHGKPAHQHVNGVCPYDITSKSTLTVDTAAYSMVNKTALKSENSDGTSFTNTGSDISSIIVLIAFCLLYTAICFAISWFIGTLFGKKEENLQSSPPKTAPITQKNIPQADTNIQPLSQPEMNALHSQIADLKKGNTLLQNQLVALETENKNLSEQIDILSGELNYYKQRTIINTNQEQLVALEAKNKNLSEQIDLLSSELNEYKQRTIINTNQTTSIYEDILKEAGVPFGVSFDSEALPHYHLNGTVEQNFHVYISNGGTHYHRKFNCSGATIPVHLFRVADNYYPCQKCIPYKAWNYKIPVWYYNYLNLLQKYFNDQKITQPDCIRYQLEDPMND